MVATPAEIEHLLNWETAEQYRRRGYEVAMDVPLDFLGGFRADLVARKGDEVRVIEVKTRAAIAATPELIELTRAVEAKSDWFFDLVIAPEPERESSPPDVTTFDETSILARLNEAADFIDRGQLDAGLLLAWSGCEAAVRRLIADHGVDDARITSVPYVLEQATILGLIWHEEYFRLLELSKYRNAVIHGFNHDGDMAALALELIATAKDLISSATERLAP